MVSDFKWNKDIIGKVTGDLRAISLSLKGPSEGFHPLVDNIKEVRKKIDSAVSELDILVVDLATAQSAWGKAKQKLQRISGIVSADSQIGKILREP